MRWYEFFKGGDSVVFSTNVRKAIVQHKILAIQVIKVKRQDGWIEGKKRSAGRGNAHERSNKYFTPGLLKILRKETGITNKKILPFYVIFLGDITRDPARTREISLWYGPFQGNFHMLRDDGKELINNFKKYILPELEKGTTNAKNK